MGASKFSTRNAIEALVLEILATADTLNIDALEKFFVKNAILRFGNEKEVRGWDEIKKFFEGFFPLFKSMKHELVDIDQIGNKIYQSVFITYVVKNDPEDKEIKIPGLGKMFLIKDGEEEGKMSRFEVFSNPSEVFARIEHVGKRE